MISYKKVLGSAVMAIALVAVFQLGSELPSMTKAGRSEIPSGVGKADLSSHTGGGRLIFVNPPIESDLALDWDQPFIHPGKWTKTLAQADAINVFNGVLHEWDPAALTGLVNLSKKWQTDISVEMEPLDADGCNPALSLQDNIEAVGKYAADAVKLNLSYLYNAGGSVTYAAFDSSGIQRVIRNSDVTNSCQFTVQQAIQAWVIQMQQITATYPGIQFGLVPNFPNYNYNGTACYYSTNPKSPECLHSFNGQDYADVLKAQVEAAKEAGIPLTFVHVDNPYKYLNGHAGGVDVLNSRLLALHSQVQTLGLRFGIMFNQELPGIDGSPSTPLKDQQFHDGTIAYINKYLSQGGDAEDDFVIEGWYTYPTKILDENTPNTFMADALEGILLFKKKLGLSPKGKTPNP